MFHHLFFKKYCNKDYKWVGVPNGTPFKLWGFPLKKMGIKINVPSDWERRKELLNILVTTFNLDWHLKHLCCRVVFVWQQFVIVFGCGNIEYQQWTLKNYMDMYIYIQWWCWSSILQVLFLKADDIVQLLVLSMVEFLKLEIVTSLLPKLANTVPEFLIPDTVQEYPILFQTRWCQTLDQDTKYLAYYYYSVLCRKALLAIVYCTRSSKFFSLYWCNTLTFPSFI